MEELQLGMPVLSPLEVDSESMAPGDAEVFVPDGVCSKMIRFSVEDGKLAHIDFTGGCEGNLTALSKLLVGMDVDVVVEKLDGIKCGNKPSSCTDQLCVALREHTQA